MAYTIYDFTQEIRALAVEVYKDGETTEAHEDVTESHIDRTSQRYRSLQNIFGDNTELIDKLYLQTRG